jgi:uncharacterized protein GlcG (DUF336 family)
METSREMAFFISIRVMPPAAAWFPPRDFAVPATKFALLSSIRNDFQRIWGREDGPMRRWGYSISMTSLLIAVLFAGTAWPESLQKKSISLEDAKKAAAAAVMESKKNKWNMAIAIVDDAGHLVYFERIDETQFGSVDIAIGKARTAAAFKRPTKALEDALNSGQTAILSFPNTLPREGGLPILLDGRVIGSIGVSGGTSPQDAQVAKAGVDALNQ